MKSLLKFSPFISTKIWGYEKWLVSTHKNGTSLVLPAAIPLTQILNAHYPLLIKLIHADETLSVQVHPDNEYARLHENDSGKTECWYILEADENAQLVCGLQNNGEPLNRETLSRIIAENTIESYLKKIPVSSGDMIYIPAGTIHAIMGGISIIEIQQSSDVTYRLYDWGRQREIHIQKSLDVIDYNNKNPYTVFHPFISLTCPYFTVEKKTQCASEPVLCDTSQEKAVSYIAVSGEGIFRIANTDENETLIGKNSDTCMLLPHSAVEISGDITYLRVTE